MSAGTPARPLFVTFTGLDERTDLERAVEIASRYPVEFAVLLSASRQGAEPRYPDGETLSRIVSAGIPRLAGHLCGRQAREVVDGGWPMGDFEAFGRLQVNHTHPNPERIRRFAIRNGAAPIAQSRGATFPHDERVSWLHDCSGGRGLAARHWPHHPGEDRFVGYAGGIGPENVAEVIVAIGASGQYWIDMESRVRTDDWFDLDKCEAVCEAVFAGTPAHTGEVS